MTKLCIDQLHTDIFKGLDFRLDTCGLYGVIGCNGAGKSTFFSLVNGDIKFLRGEIKSGKVAYIPSLEIFDKYLTANDYIALLSEKEQLTFKNYSQIMGGVDFLSIKLGKYSLGMKELFAFLYLLSVSSDIIILDELLDGLDEQRRFRAYELLKQLSHTKTILLTSHNLSEVFQVCDDVYFLTSSSLDKVGSLEMARQLLL